MRLPARRTAALLGAGLLLAGLAGWVLWRALVIPYAERAMQRATGHRAVIGSLYPGLFTLRARQVVIFGAAPFASAPLARIQALDIRLGGAGAGPWRPSAVAARGVKITYLRAGRADNLRGLTGPRSGDGPGRLAGAGRPAISVREASFEAHLRLPGHIGKLLLAGGPLSLDVRPDGSLAAQIKSAGLTRQGWGTVRADQIELHAGGVRRSLTARAVRLHDGAGHALPAPLTGGLLSEGERHRFWLRAQPAGATPPILQVWGESAPEGARADLMMSALPLAVLAGATAGRGIDPLAALASGRVALVLEPGGPASINGAVSVTRLGLRHARLDRQPWTVDLDLGGQATVWTDGSRFALDESRLQVLGLPLLVRGFAELGPSPRGQWRVEVAGPVPCQPLLARAPAPVREALAGLDLSGALGGRVSFGFDAAAWDETELTVELEPLCQVSSEPAGLQALLAGQDSAGVLATPGLPLYPSHPDFVPLGAMPPVLPAAFLTAEDARFFSHPGFDLDNIRRALAHDLEVGDFARGASTITQQLAKNLFLGHERTVARKLEEVVLAWRLHQRLRKQRILELYLNVIELGPGIRGVKRAAEVYFGKPVSALSALEAAHLAALTPNPQGLSRRFRDGRVDEGWLRKLYDLLSMMNRSGRLSRADLAAARKVRLVLRRI